MTTKKVVYSDNEAKEKDEESVEGITEEEEDEEDDVVEGTEEKKDYGVFDFVDEREKEEEQSSNTEPEFEKEKEASKGSRKNNSIFTEQDVIVLLEEYASLRDVDDTPNDWVRFYNIVKPKLSNRYLTKAQVSEKMHSLRKKFKSNCRKSKGGSPGFRDRHESRVFSLSQSIWNGSGKRKLSLAEDRMHVKEDERDETMKKPKLLPPCSENKDVKSAFPLVFQCFAEFGVGHHVDKYFGMYKEDAFVFEDQLKKLKARKLQLEIEYREMMIKRLEGN